MTARANSFSSHLISPDIVMWPDPIKSSEPGCDKCQFVLVSVIQRDLCSIAFQHHHRSEGP